MIGRREGGVKHDIIPNLYSPFGFRACGGAFAGLEASQRALFSGVGGKNARERKQMDRSGRSWQLTQSSAQAAPEVYLPGLKQRIVGPSERPWANPAAMHPGEPGVGRWAPRW